MSASMEADSVPYEGETTASPPSGVVRSRRERRLPQSSDFGLGSPKIRSGRGRGRPRGRPPRRGRPIGRSSAVVNDDASETSDTSRSVYHQDASHMVHGDELYCICRKPYQADKFMIGCDRCDGWFHPDCVGITTQQAMRMQLYTCPQCSSDGVLPKKKRKRSVMTLPPMMTGNPKSYSEMMSPETLKRRTVAVRELASRLSDQLVSGPVVPAFDSDVDLSSNDIHHDRRRSILPDDLNFNIDDATSDPDDNDHQILARLKRYRVDCEVSLQVVHLCQGRLQSAIAFAKSRSLEMRFEQLASVDFDIVKRADPKVSPGIVSALCLSCKGDIPTSSYCEHIDQCLEQTIDIPKARSLGQTFVPCLMNGFEDVWPDEEDLEAPFLVCAYPFALADIDYTKIVSKTMKLCEQRRADCVEHVGWRALMEVELGQQEQALRRRARSLDTELLDVDRRIHERQKHVAMCRDVANPAISLPVEVCDESQVVTMGSIFEEQQL